MDQIERDTADGHEVSEDGGVTWQLATPSQAWLDARASVEDPTPVDPIVVFAEGLAAAATTFQAVTGTSLVAQKCRLAGDQFAATAAALLDSL